MRAQALLDRGRLTVRSRRGRDCTAPFPELADAPTAAAKRTLLLDGELVCFNQQGRPDFARCAPAWPARAPPRAPTRLATW